jgi:hypothetical protein
MGQSLLSLGRESVMVCVLFRGHCLPNVNCVCVITNLMNVKTFNFVSIELVTRQERNIDTKIIPHYLKE